MSFLSVEQKFTKDEKFSHVRAEFEENWRRAEEEYELLWSIMRRDLNAYAGNTWSPEEVQRLRQEFREPLELPRIRREVNWFTGYQRDNIKSLEVRPVEHSDQETADQFSDMFKQVWLRGDGQYCFNQAAEDAFKTGLSLFGLYKDFRYDHINGDIRFFSSGYNSFVLDPDFKNPDLSDCAWAMRRQFVTREQARILLSPVDVTDEVIDNVPAANQDNKFQFLSPFSQNYQKRNIITFDEYYRRKSEMRTLLIDPTGEFRDITELPKSDLKRLKDGIELLKNEVEHQDSIPTIRKESREIIEYNVLLSGKVVYSGKDSIGLTNSYPFVPIFCFFEPSIDEMVYRFQGIPRSLYDDQRMFNKLNLKVMDILSKIVYGSTKYMTGAVDDPNTLIQSGTRRLIGIQPGYSMDDVQDMTTNTSGVADLVQYSQILSGMFSDLAGINETLLGADEGGNTQVSGRLAQVRTANGVRANRKIFDQLDHSQKNAAKLVIEAIQQNYPFEKIQRILGKEPTEQFFDRNFERFDAVIAQGVESQTQQDQYYFELVNLKREQIVDVPQSEIIKALPLSGKSDLLKAIQQQEEQNQQLQKKTQELEDLQRELVNSQIEQNISLAQERRGRVVADIGLAKERASEAEENRSSAALNRAKTMVEIQKLNQEQIMRVHSFINSLNQIEDQASEEKEADITQQSSAIAQSVENRASQGQNEAKSE